MKFSFSDGFMTLASKLGVDVWKVYEEKYLSHNKKSRFRKTRKLYDTGRNAFLEAPQNVLNYYNDGKTKPSQATLDDAKNFFSNLTAGLSERDKVRRVAEWVAEVTLYTPDKTKYGRIEYWSSPYDLWNEYKKNGFVKDDCDGYTVLMWFGCVSAGVPEDALYCWAGWATSPGAVEGGHANLLYVDVLSSTSYHVEGSFLYSSNRSKWGSFVLGCSRYPESWFLFNRFESLELK